MAKKDYYTNKRNAQEDIEKLSLKGVHKADDIIFFIEKKYGFSEKFVKRWLDKLLLREFIKITKEGVYTKGVTLEQKEKEIEKKVQEELEDMAKAKPLQEG